MQRTAVYSARRALLELPLASSSSTTAPAASRRAFSAVASGSRSSESRISRRRTAAPAALPSRHASTLPERRPFTKATREHVDALRGLLSSPTSLLSTLDESASADDLQPFNDDWMNKYHGKSQIVVKPRTTEEVSKVMKYCNEQGLAVVPQGGNTGLVGGSNPVHDEVILSLSAMSNIRSFDDVSGILIADAGVILESADTFLAERGFIFPLDLGAKGSCQIGGNVATNAGGLRLLRYGSLHGTVLGLEVVLPDGTIYDSLGGLRKDNTGFDLKQLFIGSEGTIGIITGVSILAPRRPSSMNVAVFSLPSYEAVQTVFNETKGALGEILSAFEFFDRQAYDLVQRHKKEGGEARKVFENEDDFYVLVETGGSNSAHDEEKLQSLLELLMEKDLISDGVLAQDTTQFHSLWSLRELIPESAGKAGSVYKYDLSVPVPKMYSLVERMRERLREAGLLKDLEGGGGRIRELVGYGHIGDGNLHINICADKYDTEIEKVIEPYIYELVAENRGSISAEHGLGVMKAPYIAYSKSQTSIDLMKRVKGMFDPKGILNPYKYIV